MWLLRYMYAMFDDTVAAATWCTSICGCTQCSNNSVHHFGWMRTFVWFSMNLETKKVADFIVIFDFCLNTSHTPHALHIPNGRYFRLFNEILDMIKYCVRWELSISVAIGFAFILWVAFDIDGFYYYSFFSLSVVRYGSCII